MTGVPLAAKSDRAPDATDFEKIREELGDPFSGIRCPLCAWRPTASSVWQCNCLGTPEPFFAFCGAVWNTFLTRAICPGCGHQWKWTSCLRCAVASPHEDWYEDDYT